MHYTQDESYYLLDAKPDSCVYLGTRTGIDPQAMLADLAAAQRGEKPFDDERFINRFPARKHDHFLIPAGTVHCSGEGAMVLEISATPTSLPSSCGTGAGSGSTASRAPSIWCMAAR